VTTLSQGHELEPLRGKGFRVEVVMGMPIGVDLRGATAQSEPDTAETVLDDCFDLLRLTDRTFSLWRPDTPMARLVTGTDTLREMPVTVVEVLRQCVAASRETSGSFVARDPMGRIDPTGLVKGWAVAKVGQLLLAAGYTDWCISAAGDVLVHGDARLSEPWVIGIAAPDAPGELIDAVRLESGGAVATSGTGERGAHIWDPLRGRAARGVRSASVVCAQGCPTDMVRADVLATAAVARGPDAIEWLDTLPGIEALLVHDNGSQQRTSAWVERSVMGEQGQAV
jgi:thiamine biosynthesis lipoprotein